MVCVLQWAPRFRGLVSVLQRVPQSVLLLYAVITTLFCSSAHVGIVRVNMHSQDEY